MLGTALDGAHLDTWYTGSSAHCNALGRLQEESGKLKILLHEHASMGLALLLLEQGLGGGAPRVLSVCIPWLDRIGAVLWVRGLRFVLCLPLLLLDGRRALPHY